MQISIHGKAAPQVVVHAPIDVEVLFVGIVFIIGLFRVECSEIVAYPKHVAVMESVIFVPTSPQCCFQSVLVLIVERKNRSIEVGRGIFAADQVLFLHERGSYHPVSVHQVLHERLQSVFYQFATSLVLFIVAVAVCIVQRHVEIQHLRQILIPNELIVLLVIVVNLVFVERGLTFCIFVFSARIVAPSQFLHLALCGIIPGMPRTFRTIEGDEFHHRSVCKIAPLEEIRIQAR